MNFQSGQAFSFPLAVFVNLFRGCCIYVFVCASVCVYVWVCLWVFVCVGVHVCACVCVCACRDAHTARHIGASQMCASLLVVL